MDTRTGSSEEAKLEAELDTWVMAIPPQPTRNSNPNMRTRTNTTSLLYTWGTLRIRAG